MYRSHTRVVRHHRPSGQVSRPENGSALCQLIRVQRDPEARQRRIAMEQFARVLRWTRCRCCQRRARAILQEEMT